ncbi:MAG: hypothetical protein Q7S08_00750 [bacterium]|nr:hypothetical protein [bacterium]
MKERVPSIIDTSKIKTDEATRSKRQEIIANVLRTLEHKRPIAVGDIVVTVEGPHPHVGMKLVELLENDTARVAPVPNTPAEQVPTSSLFHVDDWTDAYQDAIHLEQGSPDTH